MSTDSPNTPQLLGLAERTENDGNKPPRSLTLDMENVDLTASAVPSHVQLENKMLGLFIDMLFVACLKGGNGRCNGRW